MYNNINFNMNKEQKPTKFKRKFKLPLCKLWRSRKIFAANDDENENENENDWDKPGLINGNQPRDLINRPRKNAIVDKY